jgi:plastocyanin
MHRCLNLFLLLLITGACNPTTEKKERDVMNGEDSKKALESLFDTTPPPLRNTEHFHSVEIRQMKFVPAEIKVSKGDTIAWINNDIVVHDITEEKNKEWSSSALPIGSRWQKVAEKSADYFCSIHVVMKGKIVVK